MCIVFHSHVDKGQNGVNEVDLAMKEGDVYIILIEYYWWEQVNIISMHAYSSYDYNRFVSSRRLPSTLSNIEKITAPEETWSVCFTKLHKPCKIPSYWFRFNRKADRMKRQRETNGILYLGKIFHLCTAFFIYCPRVATKSKTKMSNYLGRASRLIRASTWVPVSRHCKIRG